MILQHPDLLYVGAAIVLLVVLGMWRHARRRRRLGAFIGGRRAIDRLSRTDLFRARLERTALLTLAAAALGLAAAGPAWIEVPVEPEPSAPVRDIVIAIDVSASMQATDGSPTRLADAVSATRRIVEGAAGERIGLILFAGEVYPLAPPTLDHAVLHFFLDGIVPTIASAQDPGTRVSTAVEAVEPWFDPDRGGDAPRPAIVLVTDGEAGESEATVAAVLAAAATAGIVVHTVAVGSPQGAPMTMPRGPYQLGGPILNNDGFPVMSRARPSILREIAAATDGRFASAADPAELDALAGALRAPPRPTPASIEGSGRARVDPFTLLVVAALVALLLDSLLDVRVPRVVASVRARIA